MFTPRSMKAVMVMVALLFLAGCAGKQTHYHWGEYESIVQSMYVEPGSQDPATQIEKLTTDIQQAENKGKPVAPGIYAHLGFMYAIDGKVELSTAAFEQEKALYPESAIFIDGMLKRANMSKESLTDAN